MRDSKLGIKEARDFANDRVESNDEVNVSGDLKRHVCGLVVIADQNSFKNGTVAVVSNCYRSLFLFNINDHHQELKSQQKRPPIRFALPHSEFMKGQKSCYLSLCYAR